MTGDKFLSILGFAIKAGKIKYGLDNVKKAKNVYLYAVTSSASENLKKDMLFLAKKHDKPIVEADTESFTDGNCKAIGITDASMATGMTEYVKQDNPYRFMEE